MVQGLSNLSWHLLYQILGESPQLFRYMSLIQNLVNHTLHCNVMRKNFDKAVQLLHSLGVRYILKLTRLFIPKTVWKLLEQTQESLPAFSSIMDIAGTFNASIPVQKLKAVCCKNLQTVRSFNILFNNTFLCFSKTLIKCLALVRCQICSILPCVLVSIFI